MPFSRSVTLLLLATVPSITLTLSSTVTPSTVELARTVVFLMYMVTALPSMLTSVDTLKVTGSFSSTYSATVVLEVVEAYTLT